MIEVSNERTKMKNKTFETTIINEDEAATPHFVSEVSLPLGDLMKCVGFSDEGTTVSFNGNDFKSESEESISSFDKTSENNRYDEDLKGHIEEGQYYVVPISVDYIMKSVTSGAVSDEPHALPHKKISRPCISDFSDKILIIKQDFVHIFKSISDLNTRKCLIFVVDQYVMKQISDNEYNLDDLQYNIAKAIGIKPEHLKITNVINHLNESYENFNKIRVNTMSDQMEHKFGRLNNIPARIEFIKVQTEDLEPVNVLIENYTRGIQWLGGYVHRKTGILYYNASTQTGPPNASKEYFVLSLLSKNTQTSLPYKDKGINVPVDHSTQMWRIDHYKPSDTDKIVSPGIFKGYSDSNKVNAAITIQKHWRGRKVRKYQLPKIIEDRISKEILLIKETDRPDDIDQNYLNAKFLNMIFPYKRRHFCHLHNILFRYEQDLKKKLPEIKLDAAKKRYNFELMEKEITTARSIEKQRSLANQNMFDNRENKFLEFSASPTIKYKSDKNCIYLVENIATTTYKQFKELFILFHRENISVNQRLEIILLFRELIESVEDFEMKDELIELLNRECLLLSSGVPSKYLRALRKRSEVIVGNYIRSIVTSDRLKNSKPGAPPLIYRCKSCTKFKHINDFYSPSVNENRIQYCKSCVNCFRSTHTALNFSFFETLLWYLRKDEFSKNCANPYVMLLQSKGLEYIIMKIWGGQSIISYESVLTRLRLPCWDKRLPWTPWNCILLTDEEEKHHKTIENVYEFYSTRICNIIKLKHLKAIKEFEKIFEVENSMRGLWCQLSDTERKLNKTMLMRAFNEIGENFFHPPPHKNK